MTSGDACPWRWFLAMPLCMAVAIPRVGGFGPEVWAGLINRLFLIAMCAWLLYVASRAARR